MGEIREEVEKIIKTSDIKGKLISFIVFSLILVTFWNMLDLVLLTFIISFILYVIVDRLQKRFRKISKRGLPAALVLALVYLLFGLFLTLICFNLIPKVAQQFTELSHYIRAFDFNQFMSALDPRISSLIENVDMNYYISLMSGTISLAAARIGHFSFNLFLALVLSFFIIVEKDKIKEFGERLENSKISFMYKYFMDYGGGFARTFGNVMRVQITIAFINMIISALLLYIMGFPNIIGLAVMIFFLGLIPVAGVIISLIPLCTIAFMIGGIIKVIQVIIMIIVVHAIEAYLLNPKLMANRVRLPVCFVFMILIVAEHYLKVWGLLIGVPIFIFLMVVLDVNYAVPAKTKK